jgi:hypothetical protein
MGTHDESIPLVELKQIPLVGVNTPVFSFLT